jgi:hypothetical protein
MKEYLMPNALQTFLADATRKAVTDLEAALLRLPEEKRNVSPMGKARPPMDLVAECAMLNGSTVEMIASRRFPENFDWEVYSREKAELCGDWERLRALLHENTERVITAILAVPEADLNNEFALPWGPTTVAGVCSYPYWNMSYHEGQINYVASMYGCLE